MSKKVRLDLLLLERGLAPSRHKAQGLIMAGQVRVNGQPATKPGYGVSPDVKIAVEQCPRYVSRGGEKLEQALQQFQIAPRGFVCLDVGASTGGFSDCLLQHGAAKVYAVDVGRGQLHERLRQDRRVVNIEQTNTHHPFTLPERVHMATVDVSFIGLTMVLPNVLPHLKPGGQIVALVKPQFEAGRAQVGKGGVVRDPMVHGQVLADFLLWAIAAGLRVRGVTTSPITGDKGNREFFAWLTT